MSKLILALGVASFVLPGAALAEEAQGKITAIVAGEEIVLDDGKTYQIPDNVEATGLNIGDPVILTWTLQPTDAGPEVDNAPVRVISKLTKG